MRDQAGVIDCPAVIFRRLPKSASVPVRKTPSQPRNAAKNGWSWVVYDPASGKLVAVKKPNQDSPLMDGHIPILGIDVWEHAYYLKYQNLRAGYIDAWWNTVNWKAVEQKLAEAKA